MPRYVAGFGVSVPGRRVAGGEGHLPPERVPELLPDALPGTVRRRCGHMLPRRAGLLEEEASGRPGSVLVSQPDDSRGRLLDSSVSRVVVEVCRGVAWIGRVDL